MKLPLHLLLLTPTTSLVPSLHHHRRTRSTRTALNYKPTNDENVWNVLANTERWIADTLDKSNKSARETSKMHFAEDKTPDPMTADADASSDDPAEEVSGAMEKKNNPYARKEVSYVCETGGEIVGVVGGIFRRVKEARELGERHGRESNGSTTMRSTNVVVIPNCAELSDFKTFDALVQAINMARRRARDFVVKKDDEEDEMAKWVVSINCAHLHPQFGAPSLADTLKALQDEEELGEIDVNLEEYKRRRDEARRSPYPSVIVEVQSTPPPEYSAPRKLSMGMDGSHGVTSEDIASLERAFSMGVASKELYKGTGDDNDNFYDALGEAFGNKQIAAQTPLSQAQNWVFMHDPEFDENTSTFTTSDTRHVDAAYEYVFNTLAMISTENMVSTEMPKKGQKSYIVLPNFAPASATSFDMFAEQVSNILRTIPGMAEKLTISTFHPEHVNAASTSPVPIFVVTWK